MHRADVCTCTQRHTAFLWTSQYRLCPYSWEVVSRGRFHIPGPSEVGRHALFPVGTLPRALSLASCSSAHLDQCLQPRCPPAPAPRCLGGCDRQDWVCSGHSLAWGRSPGPMPCCSETQGLRWRRGWQTGIPAMAEGSKVGHRWKLAPSSEGFTSLHGGRRKPRASWWSAGFGVQLWFFCLSRHPPVHSLVCSSV